MVTSGVTVLTIPDCVIISNLSSPLNSPTSSPLPSTFKRCTASSNQILRGFRVDTPFSFNSTRFTEYLVTKFPFETRPLMSISAKSMSHFNFLILPACRSNMVTTSASPLGLAEKYQTTDPLFPLVKSYSLSLVTPVTANRFIYDGPRLPSR